MIYGFFVWEDDDDDGEVDDDDGEVVVVANWFCCSCCMITFMDYFIMMMSIVVATVDVLSIFHKWMKDWDGEDDGWKKWRIDFVVDVLSIF